MDNYEEQSDFEINKAVAEALGLDVVAVESKTRVYLYFDERAQDGRSFDPCNHSGDGFPIILDHSISINGYGEDTWEADHFTMNGEVSDTNPLRAAMIVFLKMQEAE